MNYSRFAAAIVTWSLTVVIPSSVFAQHGGAGSAQDTLPYDTNSEAVFQGTVADLKTGSSALRWLSRIHTLGLVKMSEPEKRLLLKTDAETVEIRLGPTAYVNDNRIEIAEGDALEVIGSRTTIGNSQAVVAREIRKGTNTWRFRDAAGQPLWNSAQTETPGFWTTKKVLVAIVVVKVVALATVLRH